jgi:hypothetical protein
MFHWRRLPEGLAVGEFTGKQIENIESRIKDLENK